jgi:hypothetical protein
MSQFNLITQKPKPKKIGMGKINVTEKGDASFLSGQAGEDSKVVAIMVRARLEWAGGDAIYLSGMQPNGVDRAGQLKYKHQEWLLKYV